MNKNQIVLNDFSNPESRKRYENQWEGEPEIRDDFYHNGRQCGGCAFYAKFNFDWGLCCHSESRHHLETIFEHFTCSKQINEGWGSHSFADFTKIPALQKAKMMKFDIPEDVYDTVMKETNGDWGQLYLKIRQALRDEFLNKDTS